MSAAAHVMMAAGRFMVTAPDGRSVTFRSHEQALDYAALVLRSQKAAQKRSGRASGDYGLRRVRRGGSLVYEVVDRRGVTVATLSSEDLALRKIDALERQARSRMRPCMSCKALFDSEGPHNRLCPCCNQRAQNMVWI